VVPGTLLQRRTSRWVDHVAMVVAPAVGADHGTGHDATGGGQVAPAAAADLVADHPADHRAQQTAAHAGVAAVGRG
jgi:hypothetical protein